MVDYSSSGEEMIQQGIEKAKTFDFIKSGDTVVIGGSDTHDKSGFKSSKILGGIYTI